MEEVTGTKSAQSLDAMLADEHILWQGSPTHGSYLLLYILAGLLVVVLFGIPLLIFCILDRSHTVYTLTNKRVIRKRGIVGKSTSEVDLRDIRNTQVNYGVIDRLLGFGSVAVATAAHAGIEVTFAGIRDPEHVAQLIAEAKEMGR